ncbi:MAG: CBS domain-containing protein [Hyphomicrobiales bacterium]|nr:CBS domain-containing protein [Hyphomicrobiales bacterium]
MATIRQILDEMDGNLWSIDPDDSVFNAITELMKRNIGALVVLEDEKLVGIISERDYARHVILKGRTSLETPVRDIMSSRVICARPEQSVIECLALMTEKKVRHLPVLEKKKLIGFVSIGDLVKSVLADQTVPSE